MPTSPYSPSGSPSKPCDGFLDRASLAAHQGKRLEELFRQILPANQFYRDKFQAAGVDPVRLVLPEQIDRLPFLTKAELLADQNRFPPFGRILTYPVNQYCRMHQSSGTSGAPLRWLDTPESWRWVVDCWKSVFRIVGLNKDERLFFPFSFGPFLGFWSAFDAGVQEGHLCLPGGGMSSTARLRFLFENEATAVLCTPTYALHLVEVAQRRRDTAGNVKGSQNHCCRRAGRQHRRDAESD